MVLLVSEVGSMSDVQSDFNTEFTSSKPSGTIKLVGYWKKSVQCGLVFVCPGIVLIVKTSFGMILVGKPVNSMESP